MPSTMPVIFIGHGSPMNAIEDNEFSKGWKALAKKIPKPKAILCVSAHWMREGTAITAMEKPKTIHDFYGFPRALYNVRYPAKGSAALAKKISKSISSVKVGLDREWGIDHGSWSVLKNMYPVPDMPILQLSLDYQLSLDKIFRIGKELSSLRKKGVLILGSGNIVHNLMVMRQDQRPYRWAADFDAFVKSCLKHKDHKALINYADHPSSSLALPTNEHYLPLIYCIGAAFGENAEFFNEKIVYGSVSMLCAVLGKN